MKVVIQIPCLNESESLHRVVNDLPTRLPGVDCIETLVIDDGSTDGTSAVELGLGVDHVVRHKRNRGLASAFATGLETAVRLGADVIVNRDGDHQYPGTSIAALMAPIVDGRADVVIGDRRPAADRRNPLSKRLLYRVGRWAVSKLAGVDLPDPVSGFRAYSREAAAKTHVVTQYSYTIESLMQAVHNGFAIEFVPIEANAVQRPSRLFRSRRQFIFRSAITLLRVFLMYRPLAVLVWLSGVVGCIGALPIVRFLWLFFTGDGGGHVQSLILGAMLILVAAVLFVAGMIADLVAHNRRLLEVAIQASRRSDIDQRFQGLQRSVEEVE